MFKKFMSLSPIGRRAVLALALFGIMVIDLLFPKCNFTVFLFLASGLGWVWAIGLMRPVLLFLIFLLKTVFRYKTAPW
ncbi:hypothetical protein [Paraburkholderia hospita]|uniref:hypothetical protein n=1 Tax=Paraburkholderia hospita TaxID=169430 RepID=UPI000B346100|nr:hypothetical protein [Paraburkholderia hospita]OUL87822.1 hypothetical protein CA602_12775 [Paraburkholderia hospita]